MTITIKCYTEEEMRYHETQMRRYGNVKISDCMWAKIYKGKENEIVLTREY